MLSYEQNIYEIFLNIYILAIFEIISNVNINTVLSTKSLIEKYFTKQCFQSITIEEGRVDLSKSLKYGCFRAALAEMRLFGSYTNID